MKIALLLTLAVFTFSFALLGGVDVAFWAYLRLNSGSYQKVSLLVNDLRFSGGAKGRHLIATATYLGQPISIGLKDMRHRYFINSQAQAKSSPLIGQSVDIYVDGIISDRAVLIQGRTPHAIESHFFESGNSRSNIVFAVFSVLFGACVFALKRFRHS